MAAGSSAQEPSSPSATVQSGQPTPADVKSPMRVTPPPYALMRQDEDYRYLAYPYVELHPSPRVTWTNGWDFLWRESLYDGIYTYSTDLIRSGQNSRARYIGSQISSEAE